MTTQIDNTEGLIVFLDERSSNCICRGDSTPKCLFNEEPLGKEVWILSDSRNLKAGADLLWLIGMHWGRNFCFCSHAEIPINKLYILRTG